MTLHSSIQGFARTIEHLDGHRVVVSREGLTKPNEVMRIEGEGMPVHNFPSEKGDLDVVISVDFPSSLSASAVKQIASVMPEP